MAIGRREFSLLLKSWRARHGISQLELSLRCRVSQKHISFVESSRSTPSQAMVLSICDALAIPLRDRNAMLLAAGYAPRYRERQLEDGEMASVNQALTIMLENHEPYPAMVVDRMYNIVRANMAALRLLLFLYDVNRPEQLPEISSNLLRSLFLADGYGAYITNWTEVAGHTLRQLRSEILAGGDDGRLAALLNEIERTPRVLQEWKEFRPGGWQPPIVTVDISRGGQALKFFSTIATLGTPLDITLQEIRVESYFPADEDTKQFFSRVFSGSNHYSSS